MLESVGNNRQACIIFDNGGRPQGENLSPIQYNIGNQILLLKIELDPLIKSIYPHFCGPQPAFHITSYADPDNKLFL
jgi:hypothetical protein